MAQFYRPPIKRHPPEAGPRDCVRIHPSIGGQEFISLVGYDDEGVVQIEIRIRRARMSPRWESWILKWLRGYGRTPLTRLK